MSLWGKKKKMLIYLHQALIYLHQDPLVNYLLEKLNLRKQNHEYIKHIRIYITQKKLQK